MHKTRFTDFSSRDGFRTRAAKLAHGGRFNKESWRQQARILATSGFRVAAIDFRGFGCSTGPGQNARKRSRSLAAASAEQLPGDAWMSGEIDRIVFLGAAP